MSNLFAALAFMVISFANGQINDSRLSSHLKSLEYVGVISELLKQLSDQTGLTIKASRTVENVPVAVFCRDQSVMDILERIAKVLDYEWIFSAGVLQLQESEQQRKGYEKSLREQILAGYKLQLRELSRWKDASDEVVRSVGKSRMKELRKQLTELTSVSGSIDWSLYMQASNEYTALEFVTNFAYPMVAEFLLRIPDEVLLELDYQGRVVFSTRPTAWQRSARFNEELAKRYISEKVAERKDQREKLLERGDNVSLNTDIWVAFEESDVYAIRMSVDRQFVGIHKFGRLHNVTVSLLNFEGKTVCKDFLYMGHLISLDPFKRSKPEPADPIFENWIEVTEEPGYLCIDSRKRRDYIFEKWREANKDGRYVEFLMSWSKFLFSLAEKVDLNVICELTDSYGETPENLPPARYKQSTQTYEINVGNYLDSICVPANWSIDGNWLEVSPVSRSLARHSRMPRDVLSALHHYCHRLKGIDLDYLSATIAKLNDRQATSFVLHNASMNSFHYERLNPSDFTLSCLRLWANLSETQKLSLFAGNPVNFWSLNPEAKKHITKALLHIRFYHADSLEIESFEHTEIAGWVRDNWTSIFVQPDEITQFFPNGPDQRVVIEYQLLKSPTVFSVRDFGRYIGIASFVHYLKDLEDGVRMSRESQFFLGVNYLHAITFRLGDEFSSGAFIQTRNLVPGPIKIDINNIPPELKRLVDYHRSRMFGGD